MGKIKPPFTAKELNQTSAGARDSEGWLRDTLPPLPDRLACLPAALPSGHELTGKSGSPLAAVGRSQAGPWRSPAAAQGPLHLLGHLIRPSPPRCASRVRLGAARMSEGAPGPGARQSTMCWLTRGHAGGGQPPPHLLQVPVGLGTQGSQDGQCTEQQPVIRVGSGGWGPVTS